MQLISQLLLSATETRVHVCSTLMQVGVLAVAQPEGEGGVLSCEPFARVRRMSADGLLGEGAVAQGTAADELRLLRVADEDLDADCEEEARALHEELWRQLGELSRMQGGGTEQLLSPQSSLVQQRPGLGTPEAFSMALAAACELEPREQQRMLESISTVGRLTELQGAQPRARQTHARAARRCLLMLETVYDVRRNLAHRSHVARLLSSHSPIHPTLLQRHFAKLLVSPRRAPRWQSYSQVCPHSTSGVGTQVASASAVESPHRT